LAISKLERYDKGIEIGQFALRSNPNSFEIYNNITYAYAKKGELSKARVNLERMKSLTSNQFHKIFMLATEGLVRLREDNLIDGKKLYDAAIELAIVEGQPHLKDLAIYNYLKEVYRATGNVDFEYISRFEKSSNLVKELNEQIKKLDT
jgi:tetratricopeptide (TPR) repeat protein